MTRSIALLCAAVLQVLAGIVGGAGLWGESVGVVANSYPTLLLPAGTAFTIWSLIYVGFGAMAIRQALQRNRDVHRRTGWWLVAAGVLNAAWILLFTNRLILLAQVVIVALLICLIAAALRLQPANGWADRLLLHIPVMIYLGWVGVATVAGAATTAAAFDAAPGNAAAIVLLALTGIAAALAVLRLPAVIGFAAAVCWALAWIAANTPTTWVRVTALIAIAVVTLTVLVRVQNGSAIAWG
ncbi:tryptophan-rich sensory protein [Kibdelosporangium philippinense]|uniref:Tryptophan-rich sensory protein n=1 Tax=Kibdelosporangium philippinense TaxID=211113 RepID=A0ABS8ZIG1_9PSEU|nr:tryptophan-rich sensory protein [Kibdelosporangium philippinense]MCE7007591.1 tryptophan-rich sensory protein [Kibdelosporangium philippinense]